MNMKYNLEKVIDQLEVLLNTPSPSGDTEKVISIVKDYFNELGIKTIVTNKGALIATIKGANDDNHRTLSAHVDTLGAMVKEVKDSGRLKLTQIGGYPWNAVEGEYCIIATHESKQYTGTILTNKASSHVHGSETSKAKRDADTMEIRIDEKVENKKDVKKLGIEVGDFVYLDSRTQVTDSGYIKSRHLDDKASVACILGMVEHIVKSKMQLPYTTHFLISNYEEVGHGATSAIPPKTTEFVAIDMAAPGAGQTSHEHKVTICAKDSSGPYDLGIRKRLIELAKGNDIDYVVDIYPHYGSDASAMLRAGWDIRTGLIGPGVDASHSFERTHKDGVEATIKLGIAYLYG